MDQSDLQTGWIKAWVAFGAVIFFCVVVMPPVALYYAQQDVQRYRECEENKRRDCQRTIVWNLVDVAAQMEAADGNTSLSGLSSFGLSGSDVTAPLRTSENAPTIEKVEPRGMSNANGTYRAAAGASVTFAATISGQVVSVEGYVENKLVTTFKKQKDGTWLGTYTVPVALKGELEIRATGEDPKDRASLYLSVAAN